MVAAKAFIIQFPILIMEDHRFSIHLCQQIINDALLPNVMTSLPPDDRAIAAYSLQKSAELTSSLVVSEDYCPDMPRSRLSEDQQFTATRKRNIRIVPQSRQPEKPKLSAFNRRSSKMMKAKEEGQSLSAFNSPKLAPLQTFEDSEHSEQDIQDLQARLRERKIHQQYFRTRYEQNFKQGAARRKPGFNAKNEGKGHSIVAYDFDGGIIQSSSGKQEGVKLPTHFLDLEVNVAEKEEVRETRSKQGKAKVEGKRESVALRKEELRVAESHFLKDMNNIPWSEGVELRHSKEQCRKILGYQNSSLLRKKKIDLFKPSDHPVHIKFEDLASFKNLASSTSSPFLQSQENVNPRESEKSMLAHNSTYQNADSKSKYITVTNSRALEYLIDDVSEGPKRSIFTLSEKKHGKSVHK